MGDVVALGSQVGQPGMVRVTDADGNKSLAMAVVQVDTAGNALASRGAYTSRSIVNLSGASETLMAANTARRILIVSNEGATAIAVNLTGGTAALNTAGNVTLAAGAILILNTYPPTSAITIIGTANADVTAYEG